VKRPIGVIFSAILLVLGSLLQLLAALGMALTGAYIHQQATSGRLPGATTAPPMPGWMPIFILAFCVFLVALAVWGILTAVGLFRLRGWARYSVLVIGGGLALIGLVSLLATLFMLAVPLPVAAGVDASQVRNVQAITRIMFGVVAFFYGILCAVGVSWLVYFNRKKVREVFAGAMGEAAQSRRPFLISLIAVLNMIGAVSCLLMALLPIPGALFGLILHGWAKAALYLVFAVLQAAIGVGLWRLEEWGRRLTLGLMAFFLVQSVVYLVRPSLLLRYAQEFNQIITPVQSPLPERIQTIMYGSSFGFSVLWIAAIVAVLIHYRAAFARPAEPPRNEPAITQ